MPAVPTVLPFRAFGARILAFGSEMIDVSGSRTSAPTAPTWSPCERAAGAPVEARRAPTQRPRLVGHGEIDPAGRDLLDRRRRVSRLADLHVESRRLEVAALRRGINRRVVGVREVVQHQLELLLGRRPQHVDLLAAAGKRDDHARAECEPPHASRLQGMAIRSTSDTKANSAIAIRATRTTPTHTQRLCTQ